MCVFCLLPKLVLCGQWCIKKNAAVRRGNSIKITAVSYRAQLVKGFGKGMWVRGLTSYSVQELSRRKCFEKEMPGYSVA